MNDSLAVDVFDGRDDLNEEAPDGLFTQQSDAALTAAQQFGQVTGSGQLQDDHQLAILLERAQVTHNVRVIQLLTSDTASSY